jgi:hypothetical protein
LQVTQRREKPAQQGVDSALKPPVCLDFTGVCLFLFILPGIKPDFILILPAMSLIFVSLY